MNLAKESIRLLVGSTRQYAVKLARSAEEVRAAQTLRFEVFNLELNEGLAHSYTTGLDADPFDAVCDHLLVEHVPTAHVVGTYRLQTGTSAAKNLGYYCAQEFEFAVFEPFRNEIVELGRAYLTIGAKICGAPALDRQFGTIDFLTLLDIEALSPEARARFLS